MACLEGTDESDAKFQECLNQALPDSTQHKLYPSIRCACKQSAEWNMQIRHHGASFSKHLLPFQQNEANRQASRSVNSPRIPILQLLRNLLQHPGFWSNSVHVEFLKDQRVRPGAAHAGKKELRAESHHMVRVMIFTAHNYVAICQTAQLHQQRT